MHPHLTHALQLLLLWALPISVMAQVNGDFETGFRAPQGINNIYSYQGGYQYDDLPSWEGVLVAPPNMGAYPGYSLGGDYLSTVAGAASRVNPQGTPDGGVFQPHSGTSCVALRRFPASGNIADQGIWSQPVPIIPGHVYQLDYYVLRRPTSQYAEKIKVVVSKAGSQWASSSSTSKDISAQNMPYASVTSPVITDYQNWTHVTGTFTAQTYFTTGPNANTSWLTITYDRPLGTYDPSLYVAPGSYNFSYYAIDDVSLVDLGTCPPPPVPQLAITYYNTCKLTAKYQITNYDPTLTYTLTHDDGLAPISELTGANLFCKGRPGLELGMFTITVTNSCGASTSFEGGVAFGDCPTSQRVATSSISSHDQLATMAYPNPATESLTTPDGVEGATLLNSAGKPVQKADASGKIDVQSLPDGLYNLQMMQNGKLINQRIQVKH